MPAEVAYQAVRDELRPDVEPQLNLATFITTGLEPQVERLMAEYLCRNTVDGLQPLHTTDLAQRCVAALAELWHAPDPDSVVGTSTGGSSEACMLAALAMLMRWRSRTATGSGARPNLVMGAAVHVCWVKFCTYWDVEARQVPLAGDRVGIDPHAAAEWCDENTIGVVTVLGTTFDGSYEPVQAVCAELDQLHARDGVDVPVHVDAASGGLVAPFLDPQLLWDFRLPRVISINTSGHKYGLTTPGLGWLVWRDARAVPAELGFEVDCVGGRLSTQTLTFTQPAAPIITQYYQFLRLGVEGYRTVLQRCRDLARGLVPTYALPPNRTDLTVARLVCRNDLSDILARRLADDFTHAITALTTTTPTSACALARP